MWLQKGFDSIVHSYEHNLVFHLYKKKLKTKLSLSYQSFYFFFPMKLLTEFKEGRYFFDHQSTWSYKLLMLILLDQTSNLVEADWNLNIEFSLLFTFEFQNCYSIHKCDHLILFICLNWNIFIVHISFTYLFFNQRQ
jgi:hypothetical protein